MLGGYNCDFSKGLIQKETAAYNNPMDTLKRF